MYNEITLLYNWKYHDIVKNYTSKKRKKIILRHMPVFTKQGKPRSVYIFQHIYTQLLHIMGKIKINSYRKRTAGNQKH